MLQSHFAQYQNSTKVLEMVHVFIPSNWSLAEENLQDAHCQIKLLDWL